MPLSNPFATDIFNPEIAALTPTELQSLFGSGLSQHSRLITLDTVQESKLPQTLVAERFWGREAVNELFHFEVDCLSVSTALDLDAFIGEEITLRVLLPEAVDGVTHRSWHGYCSEVAWLGADGGLARYRLTLVPFLSFLALRRDAYIFQNKDALAIITELMADYVQANVRMDVTQKLPVRPICTQYLESDLAFLTRLLASEGLSYRFEHEQTPSQAASHHPSEGASHTAAHAKHCLVIFDAASSISQWPALAPSALRFHRSDATEKSDTITAFCAQRQIGATAVALSAWDPEQLLAPSAETASLNAGALPQLGVYDGAGQRRYSTDPTLGAQYASQIAQLRLSALELPIKTFTGAGSVRHMGAGTTFSLTQHDRYDPYLGGDNAFKLLWVEHGCANNLQAQATQLLNTGRDSGQAKATVQDTGTHLDLDLDLSAVPRGSYRNRFGAVRAPVPVVPLATAQPTAAVAPGLQTATIVGLQGEVLTPERNHQVKVQFAWQRNTTPAGVDVHNAPGNETSGAWVRVSEALAGPNWGTQFTPRIGVEVLIDFHDADMDQPIVVGQLYNGVDTPPFAAGVDSGANHGGTLSGWHSHNLEGGGQYNQWVLDDTTGQLRMRLCSSNAHSQLQTGYLVSHNPTSAQRGAYRGSGFELRTDAWGVLRAPQGLLISTTARPQQGASIASTQMDTPEARGQLQAAHRLTDAVHQAAASQQALGATQIQDTAAAQKLLLTRLDPQEQGSLSAQGQKDLNGQAVYKAKVGSRELDTTPEAAVERFAAPLIVADAPSTVAITSPASTAVFAGEQLHHMTQADSHMSAGHTLASVSGKTSTLFTHAGGLEAVAANGPLSLQAHTDQLELLADKDVTVVSVNDSIFINAKSSIVLKAGQSSITLQGANITMACPGTFSVKGSGLSLDAGARGEAQLPVLSGDLAQMENWIEVNHRDADSAAMASQGYKIFFEGGAVVSGKLDTNGHARHDGVPAKALRVEYEPRTPGKDESWDKLDKLVAAANSRLN
jgi:type VI secretion system secreted protein VgrG